MAETEEQERGEESEKSTFNILFVCTGNTCRSAMAEELSRYEIARRGWRYVRVASAGFAAEEGAQASRHAESAMAEDGLSLASHRAQRLTTPLVEWADLILGMAPEHLDAVARRGGGHKMALLGDFASTVTHAPAPVRDPYGLGSQAYTQTRLLLRHLISTALDRIAPLIEP